MAEPSKARSCFMKACLFVFYSISSIFGAYLGYQLGYSYFSAIREGRFVRWKPLPNPPSKVTTILTAAPNHIYVETAQGTYFIPNVQACLEPDHRGCWQELASDQPIQPVFFKCAPTDASSRFRVSPPPVKYAQYLMTNECGGEWYNETHYIRTESGEIWVWVWGNFSMGMIGPFLFILSVSMVSGLFLGLAIAIGAIKLLKRGFKR